MNMIFRKRHIVLASLVVALGIAVYLNFSFTNENGKFKASDVAASENYGEAEFVDGVASVPRDEEYFAQAKLNRSKSRDEAVEALETMLSKTDLEVEQQSDLLNEATSVAESIKTEGKIENLIMAKGFEDCMAYYDGESVDVVVKTAGLEADQVSQIKDIIISETSVGAENISIVEVN